MKHSKNKQVSFKVNDAIDLDFSINESVTYCGTCIYISKKVIGIATINEDTKRYDGVSYFKESMLQRYRPLESYEIPLINCDSTPYLHLASFNSIIHHIRRNDKICALFYGKDLHDFYEGFIFYETRHKIYMKTLTEDGLPDEVLIFRKNKISGLSFDSTYENTIEASYNKSLEPETIHRP
ncbi:MAG: hypothetical protein OCD76_09290 [Reichenbachiella sp.]